MMRTLSVVVGLLAACSDPTPSQVTVSVGGASWMAVRTSDDDWRRVDGEVARVATAGEFEVAIVCDPVDGAGWTWLATPEDIAPGDDGVRELSGRCRRAGGATVIFDVVGDVYGIFVGNGATYGTALYSTEVEPGVHDVVAVRNGAGGGAERVQIIRGVNLVPGENRVTIDVEALGQPVATATVQVNGAAPLDAYHDGRTASGTWFRLESAGFDFDGTLPVLPAALRVEGDHDRANIGMGGQRWMEVDIREGANDLASDAPVVVGSFRADGDAMELSWAATEIYDRVTLGVWQTNVKGPTDPSWAMYAYGGALERRTSDGTTTLTLRPPDLDAFPAAWFTSFERPYLRSANWWHYRNDVDCEGVRQGDFVEP